MEDSRKYTQLAKEGKFDELPDTCEFSEPVILDLYVIDENFNSELVERFVLGKFKGKFITLHSINESDFSAWEFAELATKKIVFSEYKKGDVVEIELKGGDYFYGEIRLINEDLIKITMSKVSEMTTILDLQNIKSINKLK